MGFHCVAGALTDPDFAKAQLILLLREWYMHPNGQIPAYEWNFSNVNPPVHAWAAWRVYRIEERIRGKGDRKFLEQNRKQRSKKTQHDRDGQCDQRCRLMDDSRDNFGAQRKPDRGNKQPEQLAAEKQDRYTYKKPDRWDRQGDHDPSSLFLI